MDFTGQLILAYLEEDDTRRVLFRVRPLITREGGINPEDLEELEQDGFLRIAPDRQEQHSFKERMGTLGSLCLINLTHPETALGKVRLNKNYAPGRGENNRYIIYSDAIQALPSEMVYEVVSEEKQHSSLTRLYYLRSGGRISGPHCPLGQAPCPASQSLMPDCERLFYVEMPDGTSRMFYWPLEEEPGMEQAAADAPAESPALPLEGDRPAAPQGPFEDGAARLEAALLAAGFLVDRPFARHLLLTCLLSDRLELLADNLADAGQAANVLAGLFPEAVVVQEGTSQEAAPGALVLLAGCGPLGKKQRRRYLKKPWPRVALTGSEGFPAWTAGPEIPLNHKALQEALQLLPPDEGTLEALEQFLARVQREDCPLPLYVKGLVQRLACGAAAQGLALEALLEDAEQSLVRPYYSALGLEEAADGDQWV